jgi:hypothetical protein
MEIPHERFEKLWSACEDADFVNSDDRKIAMDFLKELHEACYISDTTTCSICNGDDLITGR